MTAAISYWQTPKPTDQLMQLCLNKIVNPPFNKPTNFQIKCWFWFRIDTSHFVGERSQLRTSIIVISYLLTVSTVIRGQEWNQWTMTLLHTFMHQAHPTTGPVGCLASVRYPARKAKWSALRNFTPVLFSWSHQAMCPLTASHGCTIMSCQNTHNYTGAPCGTCTGIVRSPKWTLRCVSYHTGQDRVPCGAHARQSKLLV